MAWWYRTRRREKVAAGPGRHFSHPATKPPARERAIGISRRRAPACAFTPASAILVAMSWVQVLDSALFATLIERARQSPRLRTNHNFHTSMEDKPPSIPERDGTGYVHRAAS